MKMYKVKDQEEAVKNANLFYEAAKLAWGLQVTYCYHDLIHMIKNDLCYDPQKNLSNTMHRTIQASRKPSNLKKHLVKSSQNYYAKP